MLLYVANIWKNEKTVKSPYGKVGIKFIGIFTSSFIATNNRFF